MDCVQLNESNWLICRLMLNNMPAHHIPFPLSLSLSLFQWSPYTALYFTDTLIISVVSYTDCFIVKLGKNKLLAQREFESYVMLLSCQQWIVLN